MQNIRIVPYCVSFDMFRGRGGVIGEGRSEGEGEGGKVGMV
jgi:hypothetical protein